MQRAWHTELECRTRADGRTDKCRTDRVPDGRSDGTSFPPPTMRIAPFSTPLPSSSLDSSLFFTLFLVLVLTRPTHHELRCRHRCRQAGHHLLADCRTVLFAGACLLVVSQTSRRPQFFRRFEFVWGLCLFYSAFRRSWGCVAACYYLLPTGVGTLSPTCRPFSHSHLNRSSSSFGFFYPFFLFFRTAKHTFYLLCPIPTRRTQPRLARFCFHTHTTNIEKTNQQNKTKPKPNKKQNKTHPAIG